MRQRTPTVMKAKFHLKDKDEVKKLVRRAPATFPILADEVQTPIRSPLSFLPYQFVKIVTTVGHPDDYRIPLIAKRKDSINTVTKFT
jgi:hypothetical protein